MVAIETTAQWKEAYPDALIGLLEVEGVDNRGAAGELEQRKRQLEQALRQRFAGHKRADFAALPVMREYVRYYKHFDKTYHVLQQLESVALKGKNLPAVSPLVDANFTAELESLVLTAGHDVSQLEPPLLIDVSRAGDSMVQMNGAAKALPAGDMVMRDAGGISCSILYGQDNRSPISRATTHALFVAYCPPGVREEDARRHLESVLAYVRRYAPACHAESTIVRP